MLALIPSAIHQLLEHPLTAMTDWSSVALVASGAAYLPPSLSRGLMKHIKNAPFMSEGSVHIRLLHHLNICVHQSL